MQLVKDTCGQSCTKSWIARRFLVWCFFSLILQRCSPEKKEVYFWCLFCTLDNWNTTAVMEVHRTRDTLTELSWSESTPTLQKTQKQAAVRHSAESKLRIFAGNPTLCAGRTASVWFRLHKPRQWRRPRAEWWKTSFDGRTWPCPWWTGQRSSRLAGLESTTNTMINTRAPNELRGSQCLHGDLKCKKHSRAKHVQLLRRNLKSAAVNKCGTSEMWKSDWRVKFISSLQSHTWYRFLRGAKCGKCESLSHVLLAWPGFWSENTFKRQKPINVKAFGVSKVSQGPRRLKSGIFTALNLQVLLICILQTCKHHHVLEIGLDLVATSKVEKKWEWIDVSGSSQKHGNLEKDGG